MASSAHRLFLRAACALIAILPAAVLAGTPVNYYDGADTSSAALLRSTLHTIVETGSSTVNFNNSSASYAALKRIDEDPANSNNVIMIYGGDSRPKSDGPGGNNSNPATGGWNREHVFPQSFYNSTRPMVDDFHALFPADADINGTRSNKPFDTVASPTYTDVFGNRSISTAFEPRNGDKGVVSRACFYMDVRYDGTPAPDLTLVNTFPGGTGAGEMAYLNTMLTWHRDHPPTAYERIRNARTYNEQSNANPFIDHPEWVAVVYGGTPWTFTNGNTVTLNFTSLAPPTVAAGTGNVPLARVAVNLGANEWHLGQFGISQIGTAGDADVTDVKLWWDVDQNGIASATDTLLGTTTFSGGATTFTLAYPFYFAPGEMQLLVTGSIAPTAPGGSTVVLRANANSFLHNPSGGNDVNPTYSAFTAGTLTIGSAVSDGDGVNVTFTDRAPAFANVGLLNVPQVGISLTAASNEWDLGTISVTNQGTAPDSAIAALELYEDTNNNGVVDPGEIMLATTTFSGGAATLSVPAAAMRVQAVQRHVLIVADIAPTAAAGATLITRVEANGLAPNPSGGADLASSHSAFSGTSTLLTGSAQANQGVKIVAVSTRGSDNSASKEFVVLANQSPNPVFVGNWQLRRRTNAAAFSSMTITTGTIPGNTHFLIGSNAYGAGAGAVEGLTADHVDGNVNGLTGGLSDAGGSAISMGLIDNNGDLIDGVSWNGGATGSPVLHEEPPFATAFSSPQTTSLWRKRPGGSSGPWTDTEDNSNDLEMRTTKTPLNSADGSVPVGLSGFEAE